MLHKSRQRASAQSSSTRAGKLLKRRRTTVAVDLRSTRFCGHSPNTVSCRLAHKCKLVVLGELGSTCKAKAEVPSAQSCTPGCGAGQRATLQSLCIFMEGPVCICLDLIGFIHTLLGIRPVRA